MNGILATFGNAFFHSPATHAPADRLDAPSHPGPHSRDTVLVIDDDQSIVELLQTALSNEGFRVLTAKTAGKGLDLARYANDPVGLVLLDYNLPDLDGNQTLRYLRKVAPRTKVIGISGAAVDSLPESYRNGVDLFMAKPFHLAELILNVNKLLELQPALPAARAA